MIDKPGRSTPRFPPECEPRVARAIDEQLAALGAGSDDLAITQGACGADLLFAEALLARGAALHLHLPLVEEEFIARSVGFEKAPSAIPDRWSERFRAIARKPSVRTSVMPTGFGAEDTETIFERCNRWMLERALSYGASNVRFICVWNGEGGDGRGGTDHLREAVRQHGGSECWIDIRPLCGMHQ